MKYELRPYQKEAVDIGVDFFRSKEDYNGLMVLPTGAGKSIIIAKIADILGGKVLILQPSKEILEQNYEKYTFYGGEASIYSASFNSKEISSVTFATIGSIIRKKEQFSCFDYIVMDEAHYCNATKGMYKRFFEFMDTKILALTATPWRLNTDGWGGSMLKFLTRTRPRVFKKVLYCAQIKDLTKKGYLAKVKYQRSKDYDSNKIKKNTTGADFNKTSLGKYNEKIKQNEKTVSAIKKNINRRGIVVFVPFVKDAKYVSERVDKCVVVSAKTKKKERERILREFREGKIKVICNVGILLHGFDYPELDTVIMARPTMSLTVYYQAIGRVIRPHKDKEYALVVDLTDNWIRFGEIEDLKFVQNGRKPYFSSGHKQLTNVYFGKNSFIPPNNVKSKMKFPFGKHKGKKVHNIPRHYLRWAYKNCDLYGKLKKEVAVVLGIEKREKEKVNKESPF